MVLALVDLLVAVGPGDRVGQGRQAARKPARTRISPTRSQTRARPALTAPRAWG